MSSESQKNAFMNFCENYSTVFSYEYLSMFVNRREEFLNAMSQRAEDVDEIFKEMQFCLGHNDGNIHQLFETACNMLFVYDNTDICLEKVRNSLCIIDLDGGCNLFVENKIFDSILNNEQLSTDVKEKLTELYNGDNSVKAKIDELILNDEVDQLIMFIEYLNNGLF